MRFQKLFYVVASLLLFSVNSVADDITLDFEGLKNMEQVQNFYNGGEGSEGSTKGLDYNITFSANTLALIDRDAGGTGNFANEPSPDTTFFFTGSDTNIYMNVEGGFTEGFSFYYTSIREEGDVEVWTEPNGQGKKIGSLHLDITPSLGKGDPNGTYDNWAKKSLSFDGRAKSIVFKGVANQIGFDNITLSPDAKKDVFNHKFNLDKITHTAKTNVANTFTVYFKDLEKTKDDVTLNDICKYKFFVEDKNQNKLNGKELKGACKVDTSKKAFKLDFVINESPYNLEDANVTICKKVDGENECRGIEDIKDFSVYGTSFDVTKDGFSFYNGEWNKFMLVDDSWCWFKGDCSKEQEAYMKGFSNLVNSFKTFIPHSKEGSIKEDLIGTYNNEKDKTSEKGSNFGGVCHGLAFAAIANFHNKKESEAWGNALVISNTIKENENVFQEHWNNIDTETAKPFARTVHSYNAVSNSEDAFQALGKIAFYFISQRSYYDLIGSEAWVGTYYKVDKSDLDSLNLWNKFFLKQGYITNLSFDLKNNGKYFDSRAGGHSIIVAELIQYGKHSIVVTHDNNFVDTFSMLDFNNLDTFREKTFIFETEYAKKHDNDKEKEKFKWLKNIAKYNTSNYDIYEDFKNIDPYNHSYYDSFGSYYNNEDKLAIYGKSENKQQKLNKKYLVQKGDNTDKIFDYLYPNHTFIMIIGGKILKVTNIKTKKEVILSPIFEKLEENKAYLKDNTLLTKIFLPKNGIYKIELQKYKQYPVFEVYAKIPTNDGKVEIINYENLAINQNDETLVHFLVGNENSDKGIKREGESDIAPTYDEAIKIKLTSIVSINAIVLENGVKLSWQNPVHPNYEESVVVRKEDSVPTSITDGTEVYRGTDEEFLDTTVANEKKYYYAIYAVSKDNEPTEPVWTKVDTYRYTLYGTLSDASDEPIGGATVTLYNGTKTRLIDTSFSSQNGLFSFNNLLDGEYVLNFSHPSYTFEKSELNVTVEKKSKEVLLKAEGVANLFMNIPQAVKVGEVQTIIWDGVHIDDSATVNIKLFRDEKWETIASDVAYNKHAYKWSVTAPKGEAKIKVELDDTTFIESDVFIFGADELKYDFNKDGVIDIKDIMKVASNWATKTGDNEFNTTFDVNKDGVVDIKDIMMVVSKWGS